MSSRRLTAHRSIVLRGLQRADHGLFVTVCRHHRQRPDRELNPRSGPRTGIASIVAAGMPNESPSLAVTLAGGRILARDPAREALRIGAPLRLH